VDVNHYVRIQHCDKPFEISAPQSCKKCVDHLSLFGKISNNVRFRGLNSLTRSANKLACSFWSSIDDGNNLIERHHKDIMQNESQTFNKAKTIKHHKQ